MKSIGETSPADRPSLQPYAPGLNSFSGRWAVKADGQNLMVLALDLPSGSGVLSGVLFKPERMNVSGRAVTSVSLPVVEDAIVKAEMAGDGLRLQIEGEGDSRLDFEMVLKARHMAELRNLSAPLPALPLIRVGADAVVAPLWDVQRCYALSDIVADNPEIEALFDADQADRKCVPPLAQDQLFARDAERRHAVDGLLRRDELHTGSDFLHAAVIFQHGGRAADFLLAHALALAALGMGRADAGWLAAATLDRYLLADGKPQIYGTQFIPGQGQGLLDRDLIPDSLRLWIGVPALTDRHPPAVAQ